VKEPINIIIGKQHVNGAFYSDEATENDEFRVSVIYILHYFIVTVNLRALPTGLSTKTTRQRKKPAEEHNGL